MSPDLQNPFILWLLLTAALAGLVYAFVRPELRVGRSPTAPSSSPARSRSGLPTRRDDTPGKIQLGLDLRGGIHLVLQVVVEDALNATVDDAVTTAREQARPTGHRVRGGPARRLHLLRGRGRRARPGQGHARRPARLLPRQLGGPRGGRGPVHGRDDRALPEAARRPDGGGGHAHPRAAGEPARRGRAGDRPPRQQRRPDPGAAARGDRRRAGQAHHQDHGPALAAAGGGLRGHRGDAAPEPRRPGPGQHGGGQRRRRRARRAPPLPAAAGGPDHRARPQERPGRGRRDQPPADQLHPERHRHRPLLARDRPQHRPPARDRARRQRLLRPGHPEQAGRRQPHHRHVHHRGGGRALARSSGPARCPPPCGTCRS